VTRASKFFRFRTALLVAACISALSAALVSNAATHVASATSENYNCQSNWGKSTCNYVHGNDNYIKNIQGVNYNQKADLCVDATNIHSEPVCATTQYELWICLTSEVYGHGWAETHNGQYVNLAGHEDNYAKCG
jgi:hypothetical protein